MTFVGGALKKEVKVAESITDTSTMQMKGKCNQHFMLSHIELKFLNVIIQSNESSPAGLS